MEVPGLSYDGAQVMVKSTFIDLVCAPTMPTLERGKTEPPPTVERLGYVSDSEDVDEESTPLSTSDNCAVREPVFHKTCTTEHPDYWAPMMNCQDLRHMPQSATGAHPETVFVPVPVTVLDYPVQCQPICVGMGPSGSAPPGCVLVPVGKWPDPVPAHTPLPTATDQMPAQFLAPAPNALQRSYSTSGVHRIYWMVDAKKLKSNDRVAVSPPFDISIGGDQVPFKLLVHPTVVSDGRGGSSFKKSKGHGKVELKCEAMFAADANATATYRISIGSGNAHEPDKWQSPRGPVRHDFAANGVSALPASDDTWDFASSVDENLMVFVVVLELCVAGQ